MYVQKVNSQLNDIDSEDRSNDIQEIRNLSSDQYII